MTEIINVHRDEQTYGQTFLTFRGSTIRVATVDEQGETWLVAQDIVQSLGNTDTEGTIRKIPSQHRCLRRVPRSEEHTSELQSQSNLVCRLLLEKKKKT